MAISTGWDEALEKDRTRRYKTANALARDLERYLVGQVVEPAGVERRTPAETLGKRTGRRLATTATIGFLFIVGIAVSTWQASGRGAEIAPSRPPMRNAWPSSTPSGKRKQGPRRPPKRKPAVNHSGHGEDPEGERDHHVHLHRARYPEGEGGEPAAAGGARGAAGEGGRAARGRSGGRPAGRRRFARLPGRVAAQSGPAAGSDSASSGPAKPTNPCLEMTTPHAYEYEQLGIGDQDAGELRLATPLLEEPSSHEGRTGRSPQNALQHEQPGGTSHCRREAGPGRAAPGTSPEAQEGQAGDRSPTHHHEHEQPGDGLPGGWKAQLALPLLDETRKLSKAKLGPTTPTPSTA